MSLIGAWRKLHVGTQPEYSDPEWADGATDRPGDPGVPIDRDLFGGSAIGLPWFDAHEDPFAETGLYASADPAIPRQDVGGRPVTGAYDGAYSTLGPVWQWGHEAGGGLTGDQAIGRIMRFPANVPERYDGNGVWAGDYSDLLAAAIANNGQGDVTDAEITTSLLLYPNYGPTG